MKIITLKNEALQSEKIAQDTAAFIRKNPGALLCLAAGDTPLEAYRQLIRLQAAGEVDLGSVYYVGLDEWEGIGRETSGSCMQVMFDGFYDPAGIPADRIVAWNGLNDDPEAEKKRIEDWIGLRGGIDFTLLGIGMNGHVGFNEPGTGLPEGCLRVKLDETTRRVSVKYFGRALPIEYGLSIGAGELKKAKKVFLIASGRHKAEIVMKTARMPASAEVPSSLMTDHPDITLYLDEAAAEQLG